MQKSHQQIDQLLTDHGLRKTSIRLDVLGVFMKNVDTAMSHQFLERELEESDRVTLYRTLKTFESKGIIHQALDGSGVSKYALCHVDCDEHKHLDDHAHFHCNDCGKTLCLEDSQAPQISVPAGYKVENAHLVIQGSCDQCTR